MSTTRTETMDERRERLVRIFAQIRAKADLSMRDLAVELGYRGASSIQRYENSDAHSGQYLKRDIVDRMLEVLPSKYGIDQDLINQLAGPPPKVDPSNVSFPPRYEKFPVGSIPLLGQTVSGANGRFILNGQEIGRLFCPPMLEGVEGAYAVRVYGTSMEPRFKAGEAVWLNPREPVRAGDDVVVQIYDEDGDTLESYIKEFRSTSSTVLRLWQHNPDEGEGNELEFVAKRVFSIHKVVFHATV